MYHFLPSHLSLKYQHSPPLSSFLYDDFSYFIEQIEAIRTDLKKIFPLPHPLKICTGILQFPPVVKGKLSLLLSTFHFFIGSHLFLDTQTFLPQLSTPFTYTSGIFPSS